MASVRITSLHIQHLFCLHSDVDVYTFPSLAGSVQFCIAEALWLGKVCLPDCEHGQLWSGRQRGRTGVCQTAGNVFCTPWAQMHVGHQVCVCACRIVWEWVGQLNWGWHSIADHDLHRSTRIQLRSRHNRWPGPVRFHPMCVFRASLCMCLKYASTSCFTRLQQGVR